MRNIRSLAMLTTLLAIASTAGAQSGPNGNPVDATKDGSGTQATVTSSRWPTT